VQVALRPCLWGRQFLQVDSASMKDHSQHRRIPASALTVDRQLIKSAVIMAVYFIVLPPAEYRCDAAGAEQKVPTIS